MSTIVKFAHLKTVSVLAFIFLLSACGASVKVSIDSHSPSNSAVIYADGGDSLDFTAFGPIYNAYNEALLQIGVRAQWDVYSYEPSNGFVRTGSSIKSAPATWANANHFEFTTPENQPAQYYLVTYTVFRHNIGGSWEYADSSRSWLIHAGESQQTPPLWQGNFLISSTEDLAKLTNYTDIDGSLTVIPFTSEDSDTEALEGTNVVIVNTRFDGRDHKHALALGIRSEENLVTNLNDLSNINNIDGDLSIVGNDQLESLQGLDSLARIGGLHIGWNQALASISALNNLEYVGENFYIQGNSNVCNSEAEALLDLIETRDGVDAEVITIENNDSC